MSSMVVLFLTLSLPVTAIPREYERDILGLFPGDTTSSTHTLSKTFTKSSASSFEKPSPTTSRAVPATSTPLTDSAVSTPIKTTLASTPSLLPASAESQPTDHTSKTWQIIGIAIISVLFVATAVICAMFFDRVCRFLKDVVCCTSHPIVSEEFIPDCESQWTPSKEASPYVRARELPWNTHSQDWSTLHRQSS